MVQRSLWAGVVLSVLLALAGCGKGSGPVAGAPVVTEFAADSPWVHGAAVTMAAARGQVMLVESWHRH